MDSDELLETANAAAFALAHPLTEPVGGTFLVSTKLYFPHV